jgi:hypothetical protein
VKSILSGLALAVLLAIAMPGAAQAHYWKHRHHQGGTMWWCCCCCYYPGWHHHHWWRHHGWHHDWHRRYGWSEPYGGGAVYGPTDFTGGRLNRGQLG